MGKYEELLHDTELGSFLNASGAYCYELIYDVYQFFILIHSRLKLDKAFWTESELLKKVFQVLKTSISILAEYFSLLVVEPTTYSIF